MSVILWIIVAFVAAVIEATTVTLVSVWFVVGAVCAAVCAAFGATTTMQCVVFAVVSLVLLILTAPLSARIRNHTKTPTNADRLIGKTGIVTEDIDPLNASGEVKVDGQRWSAQVRGDGYASAGTTVVVEEIVGAHLVVKITDKTFEN